MTQKDPQKLEKIQNEEIKKIPSHIVQGVQMLSNDFLLFHMKLEQMQDLKMLSKRFAQNSICQLLQCRDEEYEEIQQFIQKLIFPQKESKNEKTQERKNTLLVQGKYLLQNILQKLGENESGVKLIYLDTKKLKDPEQIYQTILNKLTNSIYKYYPKVCQRILKSYFFSGHSVEVSLKRTSSIVLVIDEVSCISELGENVFLNLLVKWPNWKRSNLSVILVTSDLNLEKKISRSNISKLRWTKLNFSPYQPKKLQRIIKQRLEQGKHIDIFQDQAIQLFCQQFVKSQTHIKKFLYLLRQIIEKSFRQLQSESLQMRFTDKHPIKRISKQKMMEVLIQKCKYDTFSDDFKEFPTPYKIVLACIAQYFQRCDSQAKSFQTVSFQLLHYALKKVLTRGQEQLRHILYDLQDLNLLKIQHRIKRKPVNYLIYIKSDIIRQLKKSVELQIIWLKVGVEQILTASNKDEHLKWLLVEFQFTKTENYFRMIPSEQQLRQIHQLSIRG